MAGLFGRSWGRPVRSLTGWRPRSRRGRPREGRTHQKPYEQQGPESSQGLSLRSLLSVRTLAGQVFIVQVGLVLLLVLASVLALVVQSHQDSTAEARNRSVAVAEAFAHSPGLEDALKKPNPSAVLQPLTEQARKAAGVDFIVVMNKQGIRYTHPLPDRIGKRFVGTIGPSLAGRVTVETVHGPLGEEVQAVVPVRGANGSIVALTSAGLKVKNVAVLGNRHLPIIIGAGAAALAVATAGTALVTRRLRRQTHGLGPAEITRMYEHHDAVLHTVREGVLIVGGKGQLLLANDEARRLLNLPPDAEGRPVTDIGLPASLAELLASGRPATDEVHTAGERLLAVNHESTARRGGPPGSVATLRDTTELRTLTGKADVARKRLKLLYDAGAEIGTTLDVERTCKELAEFAVPRFADFVTVDLADEVLCGEEPAGAGMRRVALSGIRDDAPLYASGQLIHFVSSTPQRVGYNTGRTVLRADVRISDQWLKEDPSRSRKLIEYGLHSVIAVPVQARGVVLGIATFWRADKPESFDEEDVSLAEELVSRAAVSIDNARRYTREHATAVALQRSLLPRTLPEQNAVEVAYRYLPAQPGLGGVGGDWFDVIPLSGSRVALVVGDVVGHGLHATATMGRLRTAVQNLSTLDLPPDELLWHLDELVTRMDQYESSQGGQGVTGASCLYVIYDPVGGQCLMARAGHPAPAIVHPNGKVDFPDVPGGPPLGLGGLPFETGETRLPEGSRLVLFTDGLVENRERDIHEGMTLLSRTLADHPDLTPEQTCEVLLGELLTDSPSDDIALLVGRTRMLSGEEVAEWGVPSDPSAVRRMRAEAMRRLTDWGLEEVAFSTELILSELVTNAIRHATGPIRVRLIREHDRLSCEVSDGSSTSPHLKRATSMDEGGRGLFLVAQFAEHWGTRYTKTGKVIWTEQPLP